MERALALARRGYGSTSPNPMVGAVVVRDGEILGEGWHRRAGTAHAEINALAAAQRKGFKVQGATLYVTLEPCSTFGRTPPCTEALQRSGVSRVMVGATDPNPRHAGRGLRLLRAAGIQVQSGLLERECTGLNEAFNHWITSGTAFVILKSALSLDGKIATNNGESKWITAEKSRLAGMRLRLGVDGIACGVNTIVRDDPSLMVRAAAGLRVPAGKRYHRIILDPQARLPLTAKVVTDEQASRTMVVVSEQAVAARVRALEKRVRVLVIPTVSREFRLRKLLRVLGQEQVTSLLVEGGGETHAAFLKQKLAHRIFFFYAPLVISGRAAPKAVAGEKTFNQGRGYRILDPEWRMIRPDLLLTGRVEY